MQPKSLSLPVMSLLVARLLIAAVSIHAGASFAKGLFPAVGAIGSTALRLGMAALILFVAFRPYRGKLTGSELFAVCAYGASLGLMNLLFYLALDRIPLGVAVALEFIGPLSVALSASKRFLDLVWAGLAIIGVYLIIPLNTATTNVDLEGIVLGLGAGVCWGCYIVFGKRTSATIPGGRASSLGMLMAFLVALPFGIAQAGERLITPEILPLAFGVAILSSALPYYLEMASLKGLPTRTFGILMSIEPAIAALLGFLILGEKLELMQMFAIACVMLACAGSALSARRE